MKKQIKENEVVLLIDEVAKLLRISRAGAYEAARTRVFPTIRIGRRIVVPRAAFEKWLAESQGE